MAQLDFILTLIFGTLSLAGLLIAIWCLRRALKVAGERDGDFKMFLWAVGTLLGLILSGVSIAYILLPIFLTYS